MLRKIKLIVFIVTVFALVACGGYDYDWMSGSFSGASKLTSRADEYSDKKVEIETGTGGFTFDAVSFFTLSDETPLPGCHLKASSAEESGKYRLEELNRAYKGHSQDLQGCLAEIGKASTRVDIEQGWLKREKDGETVLYLAFRVRDMPDEPLLEYELKTRKSSWFW